jgi:lysophospholipase L1-like esterase
VTRKVIILTLASFLLLSLACRIEKVDMGRDGHPATVVILGSSTAAGTGPRDIANSWVNRYLAYAESLNADNQVINLAKGGYTTYHLMPPGYLPPEGRPKADPCRSITLALHLEPTAIIINLPSNDAAYGYSVEEQLANYDSLLALAARRKVPVWITTTQPRNLTAEGRDNLMTMRDSTWARFGDRAIDFWTGLAQQDGTIDQDFDCGDGVHLNDRAHRILFQRVVGAGLLERETGDR